MGSMAAKPRLLILTPDYPPTPGGIQTVCERLADGISGFQTRVLTLDADGAGEFDGAHSAPVRRVRGPRLPHAGRVALLNATAVGEALRFRPDLLLSMHVVVSPAAVAIRRSTGARVVQYFYAEEIGARPRLARFAAEHAQVAIAISRYTAELVRGTGARPSALSTIPVGVDPPADATPQLAERPTFVTVARIQERYKGHDVLARALPLVRAKLPEAQWVVVGDGSLRPGIEQLLHSNGVQDAATFLGRVSDEERDAWLRRAHVLAMPSRLPAGGFAGEGFGIAFLEAGAYGKPVVAGDVGGALDAVLDGETGLLVDPNDPLAVAEAITRLLSDPELAGRLGAAGRERAAGFAWPSICARVETLLSELLAGRGSDLASRNGHAGPVRQPHS
jgi:phosphatidylinositol alpha-1,6-mannosyltransferase